MSEQPVTGLQFDLGGDQLGDPRSIEATAAAAEQDGYDGLQVPETRNDPFIALTLAARGSQRIALGTSIAVAFARNPMSTAMLANDLQTVSDGRFQLGLGSQVQPHIEKRFSMPWSRPAARMREFIAAIRAIWDSWDTGDRPQFRGEFYTHTLMSPFFDPGPNPHGHPPISLAAVGELMAEVAGEVADGCLCHSLTTRRYLTEVTVPALRRGRAAAGRADGDLGIALAPFVVLGSTRQELASAVLATRKRIAFYASTPAYRKVLDLHGWAGLHDELYAGSRRGDWDRMATLVTDEMLDEFAVVGTPAEVAEQLCGRYAAVASRLSFNAPYDVGPQTWRDLLGELHRVLGR